LQAICHECDLLVQIDELRPGTTVSCPRCHGVISHVHKDPLTRVIAFSLTAICWLALSLMFSFVQLSTQGQAREITLAQTVEVLFDLNEWSLSAFMTIVVIGLPVMIIGMLLWLAGSIKLQRVSANTIQLLRAVQFLKFWNMAEIFFLGILVSMVKVSSMADTAVGFSFWSYACFNLSLVLAMMQVDQFQFATMIKSAVRKEQTRG
jgi:paraquat-inducible protein A